VAPQEVTQCERKGLVEGGAQSGEDNALALARLHGAEPDGCFKTDEGLVRKNGRKVVVEIPVSQEL
jgi:hypothetical protein